MLEKRVMEEMKVAMKAKNQVALTTLRAIKSEILKSKTEAGATELTEADELKMVQKMVKQRQDSAKEYRAAGREDLAEKEDKEVEILAAFLPEQLSEAEVKAAVEAIIAQVGASSIKEMGKVMGVASKELAGKADNSLIGKFAKELLA